MKIAIIGSGVLGSIIGAMLSRAGADLWFVDTSDEIVKTINERGLRVVVNDREDVIKVKAVTAPSEIGEIMDLVIFLVKGNYTGVAARSAQCLAGPDTHIMTLQNGIGNVDILAEYFDRERILYGICEFAGKMLAPGHVKGMIGETSKICFGPTTKQITDGMKAIEGLFKKTGITIFMMEDVDSEVWIKLRNNSINVVFGLIRLSMGQGVGIDGTAEILDMVKSEAIAVARAKGVKFREEQLVVNRGKTPIHPELFGHLPSTALDMKNKVPTEVDFINGVVYREGQKLGVPTPYNELLYKLVKVIEAGYGMQF